MNDWQQESLGPSERVPSPPSRRFTSPPLTRMFAGIAFIGAGIGTWFAAGRLLGVDWTQPKWGAANISVYIGSMLAALIASLFGGMIGMAIPVRSGGVNFAIAVIWQYTANGTAIWIMLVVMVTHKVFGSAGMQQFAHRGDAARLGLMTMAVGACGSLLIATLLLLTRVLRKAKKPRGVAAIVIALPVAFLMSRAETALLPPVARFGLFLALTFPIPLVFVCAHFIDRDLHQRRQIVPET